MSLTRVEIRHFQSLRKVDLDLGQLTVIVGASSSGKSALIRAFKAVASNVRGTSVITRGQKHAAITVRTDYRTLTLERSETSGSYRLSDGQGSELTFTKLNGGVPEAVTQALGIAPVPSTGSSVNFASQFDRPYLLDDSGANVARVLGELTNVNTIFEAVRLANKRRLAASSQLKTRRADLAATQTRLEQMEGLKRRLEAAAYAGQLHAKAEALQDRLSALHRAINVAAYEDEQARVMQAVADVALPDDTKLTEAYTRFVDLVTLLRRSEEATTTWARTQVVEADAERTVAQLENELTAKLREAQICPTCGQSTV